MEHPRALEETRNVKKQAATEFKSLLLLYLHLCVHLALLPGRQPGRFLFTLDRSVGTVFCALGGCTNRAVGSRFCAHGKLRCTDHTDIVLTRAPRVKN
jgi:hypothetical protein